MEIELTCEEIDRRVRSIKHRIHEAKKRIESQQPVEINPQPKHQLTELERMKDSLKPR
jgi:hypothetical protein